MQDEPYKTESLKRLMQLGYGLGWYCGTKNLLTITMLGAFEGWSGRATETWEHRFKVSAEEILDGDRLVRNGFSEEGKTLEEACRKAIKILEGA